MITDQCIAIAGKRNGEIDSPTLDRLANSGLKLTNFYSEPTCSPTRSMLLSGPDLGWELFAKRGFRYGDWKVVHMPPPYGPGDWQLYNLKSDPGELATWLLITRKS